MLILVAVDRCAGDALAVHGVGELLAHLFGVGEDQALAIAFPARESCFVEQVVQRLVLLVGLDHADLLHDILVALELVAVADHDLEGLVQDLGGQVPDLTRPGRREEQCLPLPGQLGHDLANLRLEAHVEHSVGFVQDQGAHSVEGHLPALEEVVQAAGAGDDEVHAVPVLEHLVSLRRPSVHGHGANPDAPPEAVRLVLRLLRQLARRRHHQHPGALALWPPTVPVHGRKGGQQKRQGLPAAGGRDANDVLPLQRQRPGEGLDLRRSRESGLPQLVDDLPREFPHLVEGIYLLRRYKAVVGAFDCDVVILHRHA
mmetsp:Transcript_65924/g.129701  ORF Transcript_65924/g.129701 Transcript_65924/m.129701 type:complete len:315 (-) Transcript_65924:112-1056(-)